MFRKRSISIRRRRDGAISAFSTAKEQSISLPTTVQKLKGKCAAKQGRSGAGRSAAAAFIRVFNRKLLETTSDNEQSWSRWFFSVITTTQSLRVIDRYAQDSLRYLLSDKRTKARFNIRYETLKALGCRNLVHEYYAYKKDEQSAQET